MMLNLPQLHTMSLCQVYFNLSPSSLSFTSQMSLDISSPKRTINNHVKSLQDGTYMLILETNWIADIMYENWRIDSLFSRSMQTSRNPFMVSILYHLSTSLGFVRFVGAELHVILYGLIVLWPGATTRWRICCTTFRSKSVICEVPDCTLQQQELTQLRKMSPSKPSTCPSGRGSTWVTSKTFPMPEVFTSSNSSDSRTTAFCWPDRERLAWPPRLHRPATSGSPAWPPRPPCEPMGALVDASLENGGSLSQDSLEWLNWEVLLTLDWEDLLSWEDSLANGDSLPHGYSSANSERGVNGESGMSHADEGTCASSIVEEAIPESMWGGITMPKVCMYPWKTVHKDQ